MTNPPAVLRKKETCEIADRITETLESARPKVFGYEARNSFTYLARIAQEVFHDLEVAEQLEGEEFQVAIKEAEQKFETAYQRVFTVKPERDND